MYSERIKSKAKALYESGTSLRNIGKQLKIDYRTVQSWVRSGNWNKGKNASKLEQIEDAIIEKQARKKGLTKARVIDKILEFMEARKPIGKGASSPDYRIQVEGVRQAIVVLGMKNDQEEKRSEPQVIRYFLPQKEPLYGQFQ